MTTGEALASVKFSGSQYDFSNIIKRYLSFLKYPSDFRLKSFDREIRHCHKRDNSLKKKKKTNSKSEKFSRQISSKILMLLLA